ncbi:MAG: sensor histidine kinase [Chloroflexi bacterium]|nr:sensor histidine kinase [Chloroflexota bacterium]
MSNVNIRRAVENIRANTTVYTPIVEMIVNAIQAIESNGGTDGKIAIRVHRDEQIEMDGGLPEVHSFEIEDNGIGFTDENRESFDTLYTDLKINEGGKGFGRFTCLKYFESLHVESVYRDGNGFKQRKFSMGKDNDIIVSETISESSEQESETRISLSALKKGKPIDKKLSTIARNLVEKLLPYFITKDYVCPEIVLSERDGKGTIRLNDYLNNELSAVIKEISVENSVFQLKGCQDEEEFLVRVFKLYYPKNQKSRISLVAHKREVSGSPIHKYIPEFVEDFYEKDGSGEINHERNYIVKAYVFSSYLDNNVSLERGGFEFHMENDLVLGISQADIEKQSAAIAKEAVGTDIAVRQEKKKERVQSYVDEEAPWHKSMLDRIDLTGMPYNPSNEEIETRLQKEKFTQEIQIKRDVSKVLAESNLDNIKEDVLAIVSNISGTSKNDLIHYIALRGNILDIFGKSLQVDESGAYSSEGFVHDIIFPRKGDTDKTSFEDHNLWIIDERLNFTNYVSSDVPLSSKNTDRPDLLVYNKRILFRGDNEASNPITIFEFKKPQRDDFVNPSSQEDPIQQIVRYVNSIRDGKYKTPEGRKMLVADTTPFYGYVVCDLTSKVETWLKREKNFKPMPDGLGWFEWLDNINLYVEVISWDKVLKDANMRNKIFFHKLGI